MSRASYEGIENLVFTYSDTALGTKSDVALFNDTALKRLAAQIIRSDISLRDDDNRYDGHINSRLNGHKDTEFYREVATLMSGLGTSQAPAYQDHEARLAAQLRLLQKVRHCLNAVHPTQEDFVQTAYEWLDAASKVSSARSR
jgi:hypothetical protein